MGSLLKSKSTRAQRGRSVRTAPKPRRKSAGPKPSKLRTAADVLRDAERSSQAGTGPQFPVRPTQVLREMHDSVPATEILAIRNRLDLACSTAIVVAHALREQNVELDDDAADVLTRHVSDVLFAQVRDLNRLLGEEEEDDDGDDDGGAL
jgi:hypothetical protein